MFGTVDRDGAKHIVDKLRYGLKVWMTLRLSATWTIVCTAPLITGQQWAASPPVSCVFSRFRFFFCTHKYKPLLKQILLGKAGQIWKLETMWNLQSYYLQFPWSGHSCLSPTSPGTSATGENHQHKSAISIKTFCKLYLSLKCSSISVFTNYISC